MLSLVDKLAMVLVLSWVDMLAKAFVVYSSCYAES